MKVNKKMHQEVQSRGILKVEWSCSDYLRRLICGHHLVTMEGVDEASLQQVHDLDSAVTGATNQVLVGRVERKAVDPRAVDWFKTHKPGRMQI